MFYVNRENSFISFRLIEFNDTGSVIGRELQKRVTDSIKRKNAETFSWKITIKNVMIVVGKHVSMNLYSETFFISETYLRENVIFDQGTRISSPCVCYLVSS